MTKERRTARNHHGHEAPFDVRPLRRRLLRWFARAKEPLPWRGGADPYAIWVSEVMLQQTRVPTVIPYYERFLAWFPTVEALARARERTVLKAWQGLGYYRRALHLHEAAKVCLREHGGGVPEDPDSFAALPGVGRYTAAAVGSIAFGRPMAVLDGNAARVISRWMAWPTAPQAQLRDAAEALLARRSPGNWNQAVMELGRTVCTPRGPACPACAVRGECQAYARGLQENIPAPKRRKKVPHIEVGVGIVWRRGRVLICRRRRDAMLGGLWEFPGGKREPGESIAACIRREIKEEVDLEVTVGRRLVDVTHAYSHLKVTLRCRHATAEAGEARPLGCDDLAWARPEEIAAYPLPAADVRILEALGVDPEADR